MSAIALPYGKSTLTLQPGPGESYQVLKPRFEPGVPDEAAAIQNALRAPTQSLPLREIARGKGAATIVVSDVTRVTKSEIVVPLILNELEAAGLSLRDVTVLFATGGHRLVTHAEQEFLLGDAASQVQLVNHDCDDSGQMRFLGTTSKGTPVLVNQTFIDAPLRIVTGAANYHDFAGFSGSPKGILPGVAGRESIRTNHVRMFHPIFGRGFHPMATNGKTRQNPVHSDMSEAAAMAQPSFLVNVALNARQEIVRVAAGDWQAAHAEACAPIVEIFRVPVAAPADIVIASPGGFPKDVNFYQSIKALTNVENVVRQDGVVILVSEAGEGLGSPAFPEWLAYDGAASVERRVRAEFDMEGKIVYQLHTMLAHHHIIMVTALQAPQLDAIGIIRTGSLDEAIAKAHELVAQSDPRVAVVPQGNITFCDLVPETVTLHREEAV